MEAVVSGDLLHYVLDQSICVRLGTGHTSQHSVSPLRRPLLVITALTLRMSKAAASAFSLLRQARITLAPLLARPRAAALPMPVLLPVQGKKIIHIY